ncbi:MAG TPA: DUF423 domain-containing protein [Geopsychrobacteraceae bacterium]|nr:DUF423 domain-containing protein [Geopsychrobacteraceae bacterium]
MKIFVLLGSLNALLGVALGAFGAHGLKSKVAAEMLTVWQTGVQYHLIHALGLVLIGILCHLLPDAPLLRTSGWLMLVGTVLFSGSLYVLVLSGIRSFGMITPLGGVAFLIGWLLLALAAWRHAP